MQDVAVGAYVYAFGSHPWRGNSAIFTQQPIMINPNPINIRAGNQNPEELWRRPLDIRISWFDVNILWKKKGGISSNFLGLSWIYEFLVGGVSYSIMLVAQQRQCLTESPRPEVSVCVSGLKSVTPKTWNFGSNFVNGDWNTSDSCNAGLCWVAWL